jgi:hypothetical protein
MAALLHDRGSDEALALLSPVLAQKTPFRLLDLIGRAVGEVPVPKVQVLIRKLSQTGTMGAWPVLGTILGRHLDASPARTLTRCRELIISGDAWFSTDILAERVPGPALVAELETTLDLLAPWREDENRWVRRAVGVAAHFWAKRSRGSPVLAGRAQDLLDFLAPLLEEADRDAAKGLGWGLKTLGRFHPGPTAAWLIQQVGRGGRHPRALVLNKALQYLPRKARAEIRESFSP